MFRSDFHSPLHSIYAAMHTLVGWGAVIAGTLILGFLLGYSLGYAFDSRPFPSAYQFFRAFAMIPFLGLGFHGRFIVAFIITFCAWYFPLRYESPWLKVGAAVLNFLTWWMMIQSAVVESAHGKFFQY